MGKLFDTVRLSHESLAQSYRAYLLSIGITEDAKGTSINDLDYYQLRQMVVFQDYHKRNIDSPENNMF
ncbi:hypothetical protein D1B31_16140 [Neobacillus notoginsengisoli]|uniref:Fur-regulated basic protein FbpA n=1 Tax=Neobacillus notoginsengisoli TaxID=1578198 RepID=A0A417YRD2_9BACI|nr:hypothetical protein [Neobacillus notoginsengisoli]RHW37296.1 hypothetical protein D1B31_16140 [Neobacillus notoginsengisoli]